MQFHKSKSKWILSFRAGRRGKRSRWRGITRDVKKGYSECLASIVDRCMFVGGGGVPSPLSITKKKNTIHLSSHQNGFKLICFLPFLIIFQPLHRHCSQICPRTAFTGCRSSDHNSYNCSVCSVFPQVTSCYSVLRRRANQLHRFLSLFRRHRPGWCVYTQQIGWCKAKGGGGGGEGRARRHLNTSAELGCSHRKKHVHEDTLQTGLEK